jgi:hypothetical protein
MLPMTVAYIKAILKGGPFQRRGTSFEAQWRHIRNEILGLLSKPGCVFCRREQASLKRFLSLYLHEGYSQIENLERMQRSHGFCRRHTRSLLTEGASYTIASIYDGLITGAIQSLRQAESELPSAPNPERIAAGLTPRGTCPACMSENQSRRYPLQLLQATLHDTEVRDAFSESSAICLVHSLKVAKSFDWEQLRFLVEEAINGLKRYKDPEISDNRDPLMEEISGADLDEPYRTNASRPGDPVDHEIHPDKYSTDAAQDESSWSPSLTELRRRLSEPGCLVCSAQRRALEGYFDWLSNEICTEPLYKWETALWLCRQHSWGFARQGSEAAVAKLAKAIRDYWLANVENLVGALSHKPPDQLVLRLAGIPRRLRERWSSTEGRQHSTLRSEMWMALKDALKPPKRILPELRDPVLRTRSCPVCVYLKTTAARSCDLLARGIADPDTLRVYQRSSGLCFRHLPEAPSFFRDPVELRALVRDQRTRLELLQWELQEFQRKQNWTLRYEPNGVEGTAWRRAVDKYTGSEIWM